MTCQHPGCDNQKTRLVFDDLRRVVYGPDGNVLTVGQIEHWRTVHLCDEHMREPMVNVIHKEWTE